MDGIFILLPFITDKFNPELKEQVKKYTIGFKDVLIDNDLKGRENIWSELLFLYFCCSSFYLQAFLYSSFCQSL